MTDAALLRIKAIALIAAERGPDAALYLPEFGHTTCREAIGHLLAPADVLELIERAELAEQNAHEVALAYIARGNANAIDVGSARRAQC